MARAMPFCLNGIGGLLLHDFDKISVEPGQLSRYPRGEGILLGVLSKFFSFYFEDANKAGVEVFDVFVHGLLSRLGLD